MSRVRAALRDVLAVASVSLLAFGAAYLGWAAAFDASPARAGGAQTITRTYSPSADAAVTSGAGDNNGFEATASSAYANDGGAAVDTDSGTTTNNGCTVAGADKHVFYNYGMSIIPTGSTIAGINVKADISVDSLSSSPFTCVELSYNGGTNYTTAKQVPLTSAVETTYDYGNATDTWGRSWSASELNNTNFRTRVVNGDVANVASIRDFSLDWITVSVSYTAPFESYSNSARTAVSDSFSASPNTVYMRGTGFSTGSTYKVAYYDAGGTKRFEEGPLSVSGGNLDSSIVTNNYPTGAAGTWHAVVQRSGATAFPAAYSSINHDTHEVVADDTFTVNATALPAFPTAAAAVASTFGAAGAYALVRARLGRRSAQRV